MDRSSPGHSSNRHETPQVQCEATNPGAPTGRQIQVRTIADCICKNNRIIHEWLVRDQAAIALQLGTTPKDVAAAWLKTAGGWKKPVAGAAPAGYVSHVSAEPIAENYAKAIVDFAFRKGNAAKTYDDAAHHLGPAGATCFGQAQIAHYWQTQFSSFEVSSVDIEHLAFQQGDGRADRAALRWRAKAVHTGTGRYGAPSGKPVEIMGINHVEFYKGRVLREWVLIDDIALWMQVL